MNDLTPPPGYRFGRNRFGDYTWHNGQRQGLYSMNFRYVYEEAWFDFALRQSDVRQAARDCMSRIQRLLDEDELGHVKLLMKTLKQRDVPQAVKNGVYMITYACCLDDQRKELKP